MPRPPMAPAAMTPDKRAPHETVAPVLPTASGRSVAGGEEGLD